MSLQIHSWRQTIANTSSVASAIGIAAGATTGTLITGAAALVSGVASGAMAAATEARASSSSPALPPPPDQGGLPEEDHHFRSAEDLRAPLELISQNAELPSRDSAGLSDGATHVGHALGNGPPGFVGLSGVTPSVGVTHVGHATEGGDSSVGGIDSPGSVGLSGVTPSVGVTHVGHATMGGDNPKWGFRVEFQRTRSESASAHAARSCERGAVCSTSHV